MAREDKAQEKRRTGSPGSALIRLLARLAETEPTEPEGAFADRLGQWLPWTDAIALSTVLNAAPAKAPASGPIACASLPAEERECTRLRSTLSRPLAEASQDEGAAETTDFAALRRRYVARQEAMAQGVAPLRARLRARLASRSPAMAQLAAVDAVMERTTNAQERVLLTHVPAALAKRFDRQRAAQPEPVWRESFRRDMHEVLLAELDLRMQPIEGLLGALRTR